MRSSPRQPGFTLVELLTVVGIIALLIGILVPSLSRARDQARKVAVKSQVDAIGKNLEIYHNEYKQYPESRLREDPVTNWPDPDGAGPFSAPSDGALLSGAHWLARAMMGHDTQGVDAQGLSMRDGAATTYDYDDFRGETSPPGPYADRNGPYVEARSTWARDDDSKLNQTGSPNTGRAVLIDTSWGWPILYYRANTSARRPFSMNAGTGSGTTEALGTFNHRDNAAITGGSYGSFGSGWEFAPGAALHLVNDVSPGNNVTYGVNDLAEPAPFVN
jgi:prepilin-type N-terminal cleavage/methylation domain-containing protein